MLKKIVLLLILSSSFLSAHEREANPLVPGIAYRPFVIGINGGFTYPLSPTELTKIPTDYGNPNNNLLNGLDGLGYKQTLNMELYSKFPISGNFWLGGNIGYTSWKSSSKCNCSETPVVNSQNSLKLIQLSLVPYYYFYDWLYVAPEVNFNIFPVSVSESNSRRVALNFSKSYFRIGLGLSVGTEIPLNFIAKNQFWLDIFAKGQVPNLLLAKKNDPNATESASLINSVGNQNEALISIFSLNIGILYSFK